MKPLHHATKRLILGKDEDEEMRLENLTVGAHITGLDSGGVVEIIAVKWYGQAAVEITYKDRQERVNNQLLYTHLNVLLLLFGAVGRPHLLL